MPKMAPDGAPVIPQSPAPAPSSPPSLCEQGPCARYHEIKTPFDAMKPEDGDPQREYLQTIRTCYPNPGVEIPLNGSPVFACNLWMPEDASDMAADLALRAAFLATEAGRAYTATRDAWLAEQAALQAAIEQTATDAAGDVEADAVLDLFQGVVDVANDEHHTIEIAEANGQCRKLRSLRIRNPGAKSAENLRKAVTSYGAGCYVLRVFAPDKELKYVERVDIVKAEETP